MNLLQALALIKEPNYTTQEQSKRLLDLGLPVDSADCFYKRHLSDVNEYFEDPKLLPKGYNFSTWCGSLTDGVDEKIYIPCWTVGQLIKIYLICNPYENDNDLMFMLTSGVEVPDLCHYIITWLEYLKPDFNNVNEIIG